MNKEKVKEIKAFLLGSNLLVLFAAIMIYYGGYNTRHVDVSEYGETEIVSLRTYVRCNKERVEVSFIGSKFGDKVGVIELSKYHYRNISVGDPITQKMLDENTSTTP